MCVYNNSISSAGEQKDRYEKLYLLYSKPLFRIAKAILKEDFLAYDALQESFVKVFFNMDKIGDIHSPKTKSYLTTIVKNTSIDIYRKEKKIESVTEANPDSLELIEDDFNIEETLARAALTEELKKVILNLKEMDQNVVTLKYFHDYSDREIAKTLGISEINVRVKLNRAKKKLAEYIRKAKVV